MLVFVIVIVVVIIIIIIIIIIIFQSGSQVPLMWTVRILVLQQESLQFPNLYWEYVVVIIKAACLLYLWENCMCPSMSYIPVALAVKLSSFSNPLVQCELSQLWDLLGVVLAVCL